MKKLIVLGAALLLLCSSSSVSAVTAANVDTSQGSVDVTLLGATESSDGTVVYSYQVSLLPVLSSDHIQTANSFAVTVPALVKETKFTLIGTHEVELDQNGEYTPSHKPVEVSVPLGKQDAKTYYDDDSDHSLPTYNAIAASDANPENRE
ncbi:hypothetical protein [Streptococcus cuniculi]|uniref:Uncharacterized protein n=1 Tax=Streptococcus cuniculi TaxID=1432788 RepID=A0A4Y9JBC0_9STRE|nr:hypothetical protein [Streptococcus cuniculi]MBF0778756.1 hypothetical protein [Streptococcus cuniculi]TFU97259.1 hypothetical protein E4T82_08495 [Streptococcus cuniculi]